MAEFTYVKDMVSTFSDNINRIYQTNTPMLDLGKYLLECKTFPFTTVQLTFDKRLFKPEDPSMYIHSVTELVGQNSAKKIRTCLIDAKYQKKDIQFTLNFKEKTFTISALNDAIINEIKDIIEKR